MTEYRTAGGSPSESRADSLSIPYLVCAAILCGVGLFGMAYLLVSFNFLYFLSLIPLVSGAVMLFMPRTGPDHS